MEKRQPAPKKKEPRTARTTRTTRTTRAASEPRSRTR
jgi:hypothetical protein